MKDKDLDLAQNMLNRAQKAAFKIDGSQLDRNLSRQLTPPELAGAYNFRSIDILIKAGLSLDEIRQRHQDMVRIAMDVRSEQYRKSTEI